MTALPAAGDEAARPEASAKRKDNSSPPRAQKYLRLCPDLEIKSAPVYNGPGPHMAADGTSSVPAPAAALGQSDYALPLMLAPPITPPPMPAQAAQMAEAELHAHRVSQGLCWQEEEDLEPLAASTFAFGDVDLPAAAVWTSDQKYQFIELLGRRSAANLASIAETIGKPLLDCELYLAALKDAASTVPPSAKKAPLAEEAGVTRTEATLPESEDHILGIIDDNAECLLRLDRLELVMEHSFSADAVAALIAAVKQRVRLWVERTERMGPANPRLEYVQELVESAPGRLLGFARTDEASRVLAPPAPGTGPLPFDSDIGEAAIGSETESEPDEDLDD